MDLAKVTKLHSGKQRIRIHISSFAGKKVFYLHHSLFLEMDFLCIAWRSNWDGSSWWLGSFLCIISVIGRISHKPRLGSCFLKVRRQLDLVSGQALKWFFNCRKLGNSGNSWEKTFQLLDTLGWLLWGPSQWGYKRKLTWISLFFYVTFPYCGFHHLSRPLINWFQLNIHLLRQVQYWVDILMIKDINEHIYSAIKKFMIQ